MAVFQAGCIPVARALESVPPPSVFQWNFSGIRNRNVCQWRIHGRCGCLPLSKKIFSALKAGGCSWDVQVFYSFPLLLAKTFCRSHRLVNQHTNSSGSAIVHSISAFSRAWKGLFSAAFNSCRHMNTAATSQHASNGLPNAFSFQA